MNLSLFEQLTAREYEILMLIADNYTNAEIAAKLHIVESTVKWNNSQIFKKLKVKNRRQAKALVDQSNLRIHSQNAADTIGHNLPAQLTSFVGRQKELDTIAAYIADKKTRLITIVGPGGMGKTRLAVASAEQQIEFYPDGIYFVELTNQTSAAGIFPAIIEQTDFPSSGMNENNVKRFLSYLRTKKILFVLDNFEHLLSGAHIIPTILQAAPHVKVLCTSREPLDVRGETIYVLEGMALDKSDDDAVQLFELCARRTQPDFTIDATNRRQVTMICQRVEGLPLGIELATSWLRTLTLIEIIHELKDGIDFLKNNEHSIAEIFDRSWQLLTAKQQHAFMCLSVFRGGCTREAAEAVSSEKIQVLSALVSKSLVRRSVTGRFEIHELLRQYGEVKLQELQATAEIAERHARYFLSRVRIALDHYRIGEHADFVELLLPDYDNVLVAWRWALEKRDYSLLSDFIEALYAFGFLRIHYESAFRYGLSVLESEIDIAYAHLVVRSWELVKNPIQRLTQILPTLRQYGSPELNAICLQTLGWLTYDSSQNPMLAIRYHKQALKYFEQMGKTINQVNVLCNLGLCSTRLGQFEDAQTYYKQAGLLDREGTLEHTFLLTLTAECAFLTGDIPAVQPTYEQSFIETERINIAWGRVWNKGCMGLIALFEGDIAQARELADDVILSDARRRSDQLPMLVLIGMLALFEGEFDKAYAYCETDGISENMYGFMPLYVAQLGMALAVCGMGDIATLREKLAAVTDFVERSPTLKVLFLPALAFLHVADGNRVAAVQALSISAHADHPLAGWWQQWELVTWLNTQLEVQLSPADYRAAWEYHDSVELDSAFASLVALSGI